MNQTLGNSDDLPLEKSDENVAVDEQLLVSYLDGELDPDAVAKVEERLSRESGLCEKLHGLQQTWDMLDLLPSTELNESFTRSTIEMVVQEVEKDSENRFVRLWKWPLRISGAIALLAATAILSYLVTHQVQIAPQQEFVKNLAFFQNVDLYSDIPSLEFLQKLNEYGVLPERIDTLNSENEPLVSVSNNQPPEKLLSEMDERELVALRAKKDRFDQTSQAEQERLRELHLAVEADTNSERLLSVARQYEQWLKSITVVERSKLRSFENENEKMAEIVRLRSIQEEKFLGQVGATELPKQDVSVFSEWVEEFVNEKASTISDNMNTQNRRFYSRFSKPIQPYAIVINYSRRNEIVDQESMEKMIETLSIDARKIIEDQGDLAAQLKLAKAWIVNACRAKIYPPVTDEILYEFLTEKLSAEQRERFDDMSPAQWRRELERAYYRDYQMN